MKVSINIFLKTTILAAFIVFFMVSFAFADKFDDLEDDYQARSKVNKKVVSEEIKVEDTFVEERVGSKNFLPVAPKRETGKVKKCSKGKH